MQFSTIVPLCFCPATELVISVPLPAPPFCTSGFAKRVSGRKRVFVAESRLVDAEGDEIGRGTGTFMRSHIPLSSLPGYLAEG